MRYIIDIRLTEIQDPVIWRRVAISMKLTFHSLHMILQAAMGWKNQHLYTFKENLKSRYFHVVSPYTEEFGMNATRASASQILLSYLNQYKPGGKPRDKLYYEYDYGDSWLHEIDVAEIDRSDRSSAELLDGAGACPPENCGGIPGFSRMKGYLSGNMSREEYYDWMTAAEAEDFDIHAFDLRRMKLKVKGWKALGG